MLRRAGRASMGAVLALGPLAALLPGCGAVRRNRKVAIKVLRAELLSVIGAERFLKEIETTANLQHPNILPLFDSGRVDETVFYVMPYVAGESLRQRLARETELPVGDAIPLATEIAEALDYAH